MSGRSAYVRARNTQQADRKAQFQEYREYGHEDQFLYGYSGAPDRPTFSTNASYISPPQVHRRRQSVSSTGSTYGYPPPPRKPRPIVIQSAIEKSDFRTHLDGMSSSLRGKLGRLLRGGDNDSSAKKRRPGTSTSRSDSDTRSTTQSTTFTPSVEAVPSLTSSASPSEVPSSYPSLRTPTTYSSRSKQQQESVIHKIRRFEGGGKLPQLGWKSLSNVRLRLGLCLLMSSELMGCRTPSYGMKMVILSSICTCAVPKRNHRLHFALTQRLSKNPAPKHSSISCSTLKNQRAGRASTHMITQPEARHQRSQWILMRVIAMVFHLDCNHP